MKIEGDGAKAYRAVRLDSFADVNRGELVSADDETGTVQYKDKTGETCTVTLGPHAIVILRK